jgi:hypothetical protein
MVLRSSLTEGDVQVWAEGDSIAGVETSTRLQLVPGPRLAIWTVPPGPDVLAAALSRVQPAEIILFAQDPGLDKIEDLLPRLAGLVKFALRARGGKVDLNAAAARLAHRVSTLGAALELLAAQGTIDIVSREENAWQLARRAEQPTHRSADAARARLNALLAETAAYRTYLRNTPFPIPNLG